MVRLAVFIAGLVATAASSLTPPVLPLFVRNPYLSTWLTDARDAPWEHWPMFWSGQQMGFSAMAYVPDTRTVYPLLGRPHDSLPQSSNFTLSMPIYEGASYDASTTNLTYTLDSTNLSGNSMHVTLSFLSPITPTSTLRQSLPAAYLEVHVHGHGSIDIYIDLNGQWVTGKRDSEIVWDLTEPSINAELSASVKSWTVSRKTEQLLTETADRAEWGTLRFTGPNDVYHQCGSSATLRRRFAEHGNLLNVVDPSFRKVMEDEPVFAFSKSFDLPGPDVFEDQNLGYASVLFSLALIQDPVVQFASARGLTYMRPLWASFIPKVEDMISYHYYDYYQASSLAQNYSQKLDTDAVSSGSQNYRDIVALSARQILGATQFAGTPDNPILFLKEISSNGNFQTVDVIFPSFPFFLYTNPAWLAWLLEPLLEHQLSGQYPNDYSMHDLGAHFPNATGHADGKDEYMPVEECGDMLIMALALVNALADRPERKVIGHGQSEFDAMSASSADLGQFVLRKDDTEFDASHLGYDLDGPKAAKAWAARSYKLWKQWTGYLIRESLIPRNQLCTDDFAGWLANQTNLALKGIIGIQAMSRISDLVGEDDDARYYSNISATYIEKWQEYGISRDGTHAKLSYTWYGSWTTIYNLFADALLCFHLPNKQNGSIKTAKEEGNEFYKGFVPPKVYSMQSKWYLAVLQRYGLPLDSRHLYAKSDWQLFAAAVASKKTRTAMIDAMALWVNETITTRPLTDLYDTEGKGDFSGARFMARPVVGGHFAPLALERACDGKAMDALRFLDDEADVEVDVTGALAADIENGYWSTAAEL